MTNAFVFDVSMEAGLKFMDIVGAGFVDSEWEPFDCENNKIDGSRLRMTHIDLQGPDPGYIICSDILEAADCLAIFTCQRQQLDVHLDIMARHLFVVELAFASAVWKPLQAVTFENSIDTGAEILMSRYHSRYQTMRIAPR